MLRNRAESSLVLFGLAVILWIMFTLFESAFVAISPGAERLITFLALVLLPAIGAVLGLLGLVRREGPMWLAAAGAVLNSLFALFHLMIVLFAG